MSTKRQTQRSMYEYYKTNPDKLSFDDLWLHAVDNTELSNFMKRVILEMLCKIRDHSGDATSYITRQQDAIVNQYMQCYNTSEVLTALSVLQTRVDSTKHAIWCDGKDRKMQALAEVVLCCYHIAEMLNGDLDAIIAQTIEVDSKKLPFVQVDGEEE